MLIQSHASTKLTDNNMKMDMPVAKKKLGKVIEHIEYNRLIYPSDHYNHILG
jgi:hypothetical protein